MGALKASCAGGVFQMSVLRGAVMVKSVGKGEEGAGWSVLVNWKVDMVGGVDE